MDKLFQYQKEGINWISCKKYALLADVMGLGKTVQAIHGLDRILADTAIVVCPSIARINWLREFEMWAERPRKYQILHKLSDRPIPGRTIICSYDYASANYKTLNKIKWDALIVDESHFIKTAATKRAKAVMGIEGIIRSSERCWLITGTPAPNHAGELWIPLYTFGVTKLSYDAFIARYCDVRTTNFGQQITGTKVSMIPELRLLLEKIMLRRQKDMVDLPPILYSHRIVEPGPVAIEDMASFIQYFVPTDRRVELNEKLNRENLVLDAALNMKGIKEADQLSTAQGLCQSVATLRRYVGLQKVQPAIELIKNNFINKEYEKVVLFAIHRDVIEELRIGLRQFNPVVLYGRTDPAKRQRNIDKFQGNPKCKVFIGNIMAAGTAITLTAAHHVYFVEQDWVPGNNAQAVMRCHRIGQKKRVSVQFLLLDNSFDSKIGFLLKRKTLQLTKLFD